ncbi:outer membrane beta-barrel protein [Flavobacteriaceae bacterium]|nr:outer membrane beta-barrel protein [Flavobacteriaceae bacterium]
MKPALSLFTTILLTFTCLAQEAPQTQERSKLSISAGAGFGFRTAKVSSSLEGQVYKDEKSMLSGISFFIAPRYQLNNSYSIGVTYRQFSTSKSSNYIPFKLDANQKRNIYYIGPSIHYLDIQDYAELNMFMSMGYIGYFGEIEIDNEVYRTTKRTGANLGLEIGIEYLWRIAPNFYAGASLGYTLGTLSEIKQKTESETQTIKLGDDEREGLQFLNLSPLIRLYL